MPHEYDPDAVVETTAPSPEPLNFYKRSCYTSRDRVFWQLCTTFIKSYECETLRRTCRCSQKDRYNSIGHCIIAHCACSIVVVEVFIFIPANCADSLCSSLLNHIIIPWYHALLVKPPCKSRNDFHFSFVYKQRSF